jgi:hypothetical protein
MGGHGIVFPRRNNVRHRTETKLCFWHCPDRGHQETAWPQAKRDNPVNHRFSLAGLNTACLALLVGSALLFAPLAANAADAPAKRSSTAEFRKAAGEGSKARSRQAKAETSKARQADADKPKGKPAASKADKTKADKAKADRSKPDKSKLARSEPETTGSVASAASAEPACDKSRKRLWVEGEGWVVRRVTTCQLTEN